MKDGMKVKATNDDDNPGANALIDLPVADERAEEARGGAVGGHVKAFSGTSGDSLAEPDIIVVAGSGATSAHVK